MLEIDKEMLAALAPLGAAMPPEAPAVGDWRTRRANIDGLYGFLAAGASGDHRDITTMDLSTTSADGHDVPLRLYRPQGDTKALVVYFHGGGLIAGSVDGYDHVHRRYAAEAGVTVVAVDYRLAPDAPYPAALEDGVAAVRWASEHVAEHAPGTAVAVMGDSAGGGLAAAVAVVCRDRGIGPVAAQLLIYPMLDDRTVGTTPAVEPFLTWSVGDNVTGWTAYLGDAYGTDAVPALAAAARTEELAGLPAAYVEVGQLDLFCVETVAYATRLMGSAVPVHLVVRPGAFHGFDQFAGESHAARAAIADRVVFLQHL
ncbi:alpha/beta hydrolase [Herbiconiux sp. CPCC 205763]|uniref:Alpha/beta hydrolase n=1 Tax=Herbiconiux aconitum TaxID=2970913 RepID=A0ABT2GT13_9MICO|nr:alpha/beta hydrolase [Herbiconiux aconitum]MCS5719362.1 alpha/beta hydrolase [Herbiconiux aconitum]